MKLYFVRHGKAESSATSDHARQLAPKGIAGVRRMAKVVGALDIKNAHIFASPRVRAYQTAEIIAETIDTPIQTIDAMGDFGFRRTGVEQLMADVSPAAHVFFVGHNPYMSEIAGGFIGTDLSMKTGAIACVESYEQAGRGGMLLWYLYPGLLNSVVDV